MAEKKESAPVLNAVTCGIVELRRVSLFELDVHETLQSFLLSSTGQIYDRDRTWNV